MKGFPTCQPGICQDRPQKPPTNRAACQHLGRDGTPLFTDSCPSKSQPKSSCIVELSLARVQTRTPAHSPTCMDSHEQRKSATATAGSTYTIAVLPHSLLQVQLKLKLIVRSPCQAASSLLHAPIHHAIRCIIFISHVRYRPALGQHISSRRAAAVQQGEAAVAGKQ